VETCANCDKFRDDRLITHGNVDIFGIDPEAAARPGRLDARKNGSSRRESHLLTTSDLPGMPARMTETKSSRGLWSGEQMRHERNDRED
jgi:hypothetical protein